MMVVVRERGEIGLQLTVGYYMEILHLKALSPKSQLTSHVVDP